MSILYVARSVALSKWAADVGLSKHVYKIGATAAPLKTILAAGFADFPNWTKIAEAPGIDGLDDAAIAEKLRGRVKLVDPTLYPRIKGLIGLCKVTPAQVENHIVLTRALAGAEESSEFKLKPADFGAFLLHLATR